MNNKIPEAVPVESEGIPVVNNEEWFPSNWDEIKLTELRKILYKYDIQDEISHRIKHLLCGTKKVLVLDNSGSMNLALRQTSIQSDKPVRRYDELLQFIELALPFLVLEEPNGIDVWLLNNVGGDIHGTPGPFVIENVQTVDQLRPYLQKPCGRTPLVQCMNNLFRTLSENMNEEGLHLIVATDGAPDNVGNSLGRDALYDLLSENSTVRRNPSKCIVNFIVCSDNDSDVEYLDRIDKYCPYVDVTDDYTSEAEQVASKNTMPRPLSIGDWVLKALIGASDPSLDGLDESIYTTQHIRNKDCCIII